MTSEETRIGSELRRRREELGLTIEEMALRTRIGRSYLTAMENDQYEDFPGEAYQIGFLRNYAKALGLDDVEMAERFREQTGRGKALTKEVASRPTPAPPGHRQGSVSSPLRPSRKGKGMFWPTALVVIGAAAAAVLLSLPEHPDRPASPSHVPPVPQGPTAEAPPAQGALVDGAGSNALPLPPSVAGQEPTAAESQPIMSPGEPPLPSVPATGAVLRLVALGSTELEIALDQKPPQVYHLEEKTALKWTVSREVRFRVSDPHSVRFWLGDREFDLGNRQEARLGPAFSAGSAEVKP